MQVSDEIEIEGHGRGAKLNESDNATGQLNSTAEGFLEKDEGYQAKEDAEKSKKDTIISNFHAEL